MASPAVTSNTSDQAWLTEEQAKHRLRLDGFEEFPLVLTVFSVMEQGGCPGRAC